MFAMMYSCKEAVYTDDEIDLIWAGESFEPMQLFTVNNTADSMFLRQTARKLKLNDISDSTTIHLTKRMLATVTSPLNQGLGIAAPQVGVGVNMVYVQRLDKLSQPYEIYYNPVIEEYGDSINSGMEGCLSIPSFRGSVERSHNIVVSFIDSTGNKQRESISGFTAVIFQHEIDHLNGILYFDHIFNGFEALIQVEEE
jgi:peptide deformylase